ncbi:hypothetical protein vBEcoMWL3_gp074 [Escherichia phage vB_EcoM_WL-3]|nr:hypothetical protein vBEcoMWL3_gp074 [Escherichia phage vB_EcoM_WL-3]
MHPVFYFNRFKIVGKIEIIVFRKCIMVFDDFTQNCINI